MSVSGLRMFAAYRLWTAAVTIVSVSAVSPGAAGILSRFFGIGALL